MIVQKFKVESSAFELENRQNGLHKSHKVEAPALVAIRPSTALVEVTCLRASEEAVEAPEGAFGSGAPS